MGLVTKEIELPDPAALRKPAGMPSFKRDPISEITAFDRFAGDRQRTILIAAGAGVALLILYTLMASRAAPEKDARTLIAEVQKEALVQRAQPAVAPALEAAPAAEPEPVGAPEPAVVAPPSAASTGRLRVESEPRLAVYEGETKLGRTPLEVELAAGTHELRLVNKKLHLQVTRKVEVRGGKTRSLSFDFGVAKLKITAPDGTKVYLDRRFVGETPLDPIRLAEGSHRLELAYGDQRLKETLDVLPSTTIDYRPHFDR